MFGILLYDLLFFSIPVSLAIFFGISLYRYRSAKSQNEREPGSFSPKKIKGRRTVLIVASVMAGIFLAVVLGIIVLFVMAIAYM